MYWHIVDPYTACFLVSNVTQALVERVQATLRQVLGFRTLQEVIENRDSIGNEIERQISGPAASWGIAIEATLIKDLIFDNELQQILSAAAKQQRIGKARPFCYCKL